MAQAEPTRLTVLDGRLSFSVPADWEKRTRPNTAFSVESTDPNAWAECTLTIDNAPSMGRGQAEANEQLRQYMTYRGPKLEGSETLHHSSFEDRDGVTIFKSASTANELTNERRAFYLIDEDRVDVVTIMCFYYPEDKASALPAVTQFLGSLRIAGR